MDFCHLRQYQTLSNSIWWCRKRWKSTHCLFKQLFLEILKHVHLSEYWVKTTQVLQYTSNILITFFNYSVSNEYFYILAILCSKIVKQLKVKLNFFFGFPRSQNKWSYKMSVSMFFSIQKWGENYNCPPNLQLSHINRANMGHKLGFEQFWK